MYIEVNHLVSDSVECQLKASFTRVGEALGSRRVGHVAWAISLAAALTTYKPPVVINNNLLFSACQVAIGVYDMCLMSEVSYYL